MEYVESIERQMNVIEKALNVCLEKGIKKSVRRVKKKTKELNTTVVRNLVYKKYTPKYYVRRGINGGLADSHNITFDNPVYEISHLKVECELTVYNNTKPNPSKFYFNKSYIDLNNKDFYNNYFVADMIQKKNFNIPNTPRLFIGDDAGENGLKQRSEASAIDLVFIELYHEIKNKLGINIQ